MVRARAKNGELSDSKSFTQIVSFRFLMFTILPIEWPVHYPSYRMDESLYGYFCWVSYVNDLYCAEVIQGARAFRERAKPNSFCHHA
jgi:hypothetical protein